MNVPMLAVNGWPCTICDCPAGLFLFHDCVGFKTEYRIDGFSDVYVAESGEVFWGGTNDKGRRERLVVQPLILHSPPRQELAAHESL